MTTAALSATQAALAPTMPPVQTSVAVLAPPHAPTGSGSAIAPAPPADRLRMPILVAGIEVTPFRAAGVVLAILAFGLLIGSLLLGRLARATR